jgi:hypothetical protein
MEIDVKWQKALELKEDRKGNLIYACPQQSKIPEKAGVYVFLRKFGKSYEPLYVGETGNLRRRIRQHLENNLRLMRAIENLEIGKRLILVGVIRFKPGQKALTVQRLLQEALIRHCLSGGHELLNQHGVSPKVHTVAFAGNRVSENVFGRRLLVQAQQ